MSLNEKNVLSDYDKTKAALEETLVSLQRGDVDLIPALLAMGNVYAEIVASNLPYEIALELVAGIKLKIEKLNLEKAEGLPVV